MKVKTYIKKCNMKQLAQLLSSSWWCDQDIEVTFGNEVFEARAKYLYNVIFQKEMPEVIRLGQNSYLNTKTNKKLNF